MGHSLGAGAAALLAIMLRNSYPQVRCYAFSPPRGLLRYAYFHMGNSVLCISHMVETGLLFVIIISHPQEKFVSKHYLVFHRSGYI